MEEVKIPSREEAESLLAWANEQNPGAWAKHCEVVAGAAEAIAAKCGLDSERAYVSGLLHDIGRYEGVRDLHHIYAGYALLNSKGYKTAARICLSHSFPYQNLGAYSGSDYDCTEDELAVIVSFLEQIDYDNYDKLIQLCDSLGSADGVCIIEKRITNVVLRYGFNDFTLRKWESIFKLKNYFDKLCGMNIYDLFYDEIRRVSFM